MPEGETPEPRPKFRVIEGGQSEKSKRAAAETHRRFRQKVKDIAAAYESLDTNDMLEDLIKRAEKRKKSPFFRLKNRLSKNK